METELNLLFATTPKRRPALAWRLALGLVVLTGLLWGAASELCAQSNGPEEYTFLTLAGPAESGPDAIDGSGSVARFNAPKNLAVDGTGNVYVADSGNHTIRKITPAGIVTTLAGLAGRSGSADGTGSGARFSSLWGIAVDGAGNVYVTESESFTIRKVTAAGVVTTLAGQPGSIGRADGTGSEARFNRPLGIAVDGDGNLFVADSESFYGSQGCAIRKISPTGVVTTLAVRSGNNPSPFDGTLCHSIQGVAVDTTGNVYVTEAPTWCYDGNVIWKIGPGGEVANFASGSPFLALDSAGNVYVPKSNAQLRKITPAGVVTTLVGVDDAGNEVRFADPSGIAVDRAGNVYVADGGAIRKMAPGGLVTTIAGKVQPAASVDGAGNAARFYEPSGVAVDGDGNVYVAEWSNTIRKIAPGGEVTTVAGLAGESGFADGTGSDARFSQPTGIAVDGASNVYVADWGNNTIRKISPQGAVTTLAGDTSITECGSPAPGYADGPGNVARFNKPRHIAVDSAGYAYVAEQYNHTLRKISPAGVVTTLAGNALIKDQNGNPKGGYADGTGSAARFNYPLCVAVDGAGNVYVTDSGNQTIRKITPGGVVTTIAGSSQDTNGDGWADGGYADGTSSAARFNWPHGVAVDPAGNVYVADNTMIRRINPTGLVTTLAGQPGSAGSSDGTGSAARFNELGAVAVDSAGNLHVADFGNNTIRIGTPHVCADRPVVNLALAPVSVLRQLNTQPQTAAAWQWSVIRRPAGSQAELSSTTVRNPTFMPDVADLFVLRLKTTDASGGISIRTLELTAVPAHVAVLASPHLLADGSFQLTLVGQTNQAYTLQVSTDLTTWTDWTNMTTTRSSTPLADFEVSHEPQRFYRAVSAP